MKTTRELAREEIQKNLVQNLQELLVKNYDADKGLKKAIREVSNPDLKQYLKGQAIMHYRFANELDRLIHSLNASPIEEGSTAGMLHRLWMDIIHSIPGSDDTTILNECKRGQKATLKDYRDKIKAHKFPPQILEVLKKQLLELNTSLNPPDLRDNVA